MGPNMRTLYLCYLSVLEALTESQVIPYLAFLARRGIEVHLLTFEPNHRWNREAIAARGVALRASGIHLHTLSYHKRPSLPATAYDVLRGVFRGWRLVRAHGIQVVHARSHVPAADFSILLAKPCASLLAGCPTKIGESLASGLPLVLSTGVGDADQLVAEGVAAPVPALAAEHYRAAARWVAAVAGRPETGGRCRRVAERYFDLEAVGGSRYWALYRALAARS